MAGVGPSEIYQELLSLGASTTQAIGIMANMVNESSFNPEAIGDQGTSFGLVQQHGNYGYLVTGNPVADMKAQLKLLVQNGGLGAASGSSAAAAAGNFAANYERCVGCQPGGAQYSSRVGNVAQLLQDLATGKWPTSGGSGGGGGGGGRPGPSPSPTGGGGGDGGAPANYPSAWDVAPNTPTVLTSFNPFGFINDIFDPFQAIQDAASNLSKVMSPETFDVVKVFKVLTSAFASFQNGLKTIVNDIHWLFVPSHWVRVFAFLFGITVMVPAAYALMHTGTGDMYLAMGIALTTLAGVLLFIAFHNLPDDVRNLQSLLLWISLSIRQGHAAGSLSGVTGTPGVPGPPGTQLFAKHNPLGSFAEGGAVTPSGGTQVVPVPDATSIFPIIGQVFPTPSGNPPLPTQLTA